MRTLNGLSVVVMVVFGILAAGCGSKRDMHVEIKAEEREKDQPSAALVRKVELTYHTPGGEEKLRQGIAVLGLGQPVSVSADQLKEIEVEKGGVFEARGYASDGILLLRGTAQADPEARDTIDITLSRSASQSTVLGSPLLRRVRLADASLPRGFMRDAREVQAESEGGRCVEVPPFKMDNAGISPKIVLEGAVKAPSFKAEISVASGRGAQRKIPEAFPLRINSAGDAELELGQAFLDGALYKSSVRMEVRIYSNQYEGCLRLATHPVMLPVRVDPRMERGVNDEIYSGAVAPSQTLMFSNPNSADVQVKFTASIADAGSAAALGSKHQICYSFSNDPQRASSLSCREQLSEVFVMRANEGRGISFFLGLMYIHGSGVFFRPHKLSLGITMVTTLVGSDSPESTISQSFSNVLP